MSIQDDLQRAASAHQGGQLAEAAQFYRHVLAVEPNHYTALHALGLIELQTGNPEQCIAHIQAALKLNPYWPAAHYNLGIALKRQGQLDAAIACYRRALQLKPDHAGAHTNLGNALQDQGQTDEAIACYRRALDLNPDHAETHFNLANALKQQGKLDDAIACYRRAAELKPQHAEAHTNQAILLLLKGDFQSGWPEYEWRWRTNQLQEPDFAQRRWDGSPLGSRTLLLWAEQGFGDTIQFIRYATLVKQHNAAATIVVQCEPQLVHLLSRCPGIDHLAVQGGDLPPFDVHSPLLSLPNVLHTSLATIPSAVPYLSADPALVAHWRERLNLGAPLRIGINWQGRSDPGDHQKRNIPFSYFAALAQQLPGISLVSLQKGASPAELALVATPDRIVHPGSDFDTVNGAFVDTVAIMTNLDLVISSDTSVPHLAGALGIPVWVPLPFDADWRWLLGRSDSPWYPTMRLFRQPTRGDWAPVFHEIARTLNPMIPDRTN